MNKNCPGCGKWVTKHHRHLFDGKGRRWHAKCWELYIKQVTREKGP